MPRRRESVLLPIETRVLELGLRRMRDGDAEFHGFALAREMGGDGDRLTAHGTLYKVLERLERRGLLRSRWEDPREIEGARPRRRLYQVTDEAAGALRKSRDLRVPAPPKRPRVAAPTIG